MGQPGRGVGACAAGARPGAGQQLARGALPRSGSCTGLAGGVGAVGVGLPAGGAVDRTGASRWLTR